jgi:molybdopterin synthase catalytic subunit
LSGLAPERREIRENWQRGGVCDRMGPSVLSMAKYRVLLFASLRERAKTDAIDVEISEHTTVAQLLEDLGRTHPTLAPLLPGCRVALDQEFVALTDTIPEAAEIALIPPVSGGHDGRVRLGHDPLRLCDVVAAVEHRGAGAVATFTGNVRALSRGQEIAHLEYEAYGPMALRVMAEIVEKVEATIPGARVAIHHRLGHLEVGEAAVVIAASAPHRAEAFGACREAIEALKRDVPIWKKEVSIAGATWIGQGP